MNTLGMFRSRLWTGSRNPEAEFSLLANATYTGIDDAIDAPAVHIIGNSLDIIVCAYYSHRSTHSHRRTAAPERSPPPAGLQQRGWIVSDTCLLARVEFCPTLDALRKWSFEDPRIRTIRTEDLMADVNSTFGEIVANVMQTEIIRPDREDMMFKRITGGRRVGEVDADSHYRSGRPEISREALPEPVIAYMRIHVHDLLRGYYPDVLA